MARGEHWTKEQDERTVAAYFAMWGRLRAGESVNKARTYRELGEEIGRVHKAVERKFQNISAVLQDLGSTTWVPGLKPFSNYQELLADSVIEWLDAHELWLAQLDDGERRAARETLTNTLGGQIEVAPPVRDAPLVQALNKVASGRNPRVLDFLEINQRNRDLGRNGEEFIVEHERRWLHDVVRAPQLAKRVEWVSQTEGDGLGYDVVSFGEDGSPRLIEVKTTTLGKCTPFFLTRNEVAVSRREGGVYQLYRLFNFTGDPRFYRLPGPLDESCILEPTTFVGRAARSTR